VKAARCPRRRPGDAPLEEGLKCNLDTRQPQRSDGWAPAGMSVSIRARRPAFDKRALLLVARFVVLLSAQPTAPQGLAAERELMVCRTLVR
jgi:hypothetical protein